MLLALIFLGFSIISSFAGLLLLFLFQTRAEARKFSIYSFWVAQKHEKIPFGVSVMCRNMKKFHLVFLSCAEAWKSFIWCFCRVQKHEKVSFGVSVVCRSMKKFHLVFLTRAEEWKSFIWCFWREQKREKVSFGVSETFRSIKKQNKLIMLLIYYYCCPLKCVTIIRKTKRSEKIKRSVPPRKTKRSFSRSPPP